MQTKAALVGPFVRAIASYVPGLDSIGLRDFSNLFRTGFGRIPHESDFLALRTLLPKPSPVVLDVGANRGQSIRSLRAVLGAADIWAVEPNPRLARHLRMKFPDVKVRNVALGAKPGELELFVPRYGRLSWDTRASGDRETAIQAFRPDEIWRFRHSRVSLETLVVEVTTIDLLGVAPDVIKVDTEGMEPDVIAGGLETIRAHRPILMIEGSAERVAEMLAGLGYLRYRWEPATRTLEPGAGELNTLFLWNG